MIKMPWNNSTAPNLMLEVTDSCNINCGVCYKKRGNTFKTLSQIEHELETALKLRRLHTITISGGEPTLHPDLKQIISHIKAYNLHVFLLTNGLKITEEYLSQLKDGGLDSILYHVDIGQDRADLPESPSFDDVKKRLSELASIAVSLKIDVSISVTLYKQSETFSKKIIDYFFNSPDLSFLFIAKAFDFNSKILSQRNPARNELFHSSSINDIRNYFETEYSIEPYSYIPSSNSKHSCWVSFYVPVIFHSKGPSTFRVKSNITDLWLFEMARRFAGRYIHKTTQNPLVTFMRVLINGVSTTRLIPLFQFYKRLFEQNSILRHKMIVYDDGPFPDENGNVVNCQYCPTAIVREDSIVPCCVADYNIIEGKPYDCS